jgi:hypothetical protein
MTAGDQAGHPWRARRGADQGSPGRERAHPGHIVTAWRLAPIPMRDHAQQRSISCRWSTSYSLRVFTKEREHEMAVRLIDMMVAFKRMRPVPGGPTRP